ncbi:MAG: folate-binding protein [Rhodospirillaceae bacterium]|nr:folate-binding protein [Rhodospirillaceae bacterium]
MSNLSFSQLNGRGIIKISGPDAREFLQGLVSGDVNNVTANNAIWSAFLSPQGKYLYDFFIGEIDGALVLDCERERLGGFLKKLSMFKLKAQVEISDETNNLSVFAAWGNGYENAIGITLSPGTSTQFGGGIAFVDPRSEKIGARIIAPEQTAMDALVVAGFASTDIGPYNHLRIKLGLPDGSRDMTVDRALLLENGFEELGGVSFEKGCYIGQEVTARTRYRGLVKKRLVPVLIDGPAPEPGTPIICDEREVGEMKSSEGDMGLALIRVESLNDEKPLIANGANLKPAVPEWVVIREQE